MLKQFKGWGWEASEVKIFMALDITGISKGWGDISNQKIFHMRGVDIIFQTASVKCLSHNKVIFRCNFPANWLQIANHKRFGNRLLVHNYSTSFTWKVSISYTCKEIFRSVITAFQAMISEFPGKGVADIIRSIIFTGKA